MARRPENLLYVSSYSMAKIDNARKLKWTHFSKLTNPPSLCMNSHRVSSDRSPSLNPERNPSMYLRMTGVKYASAVAEAPRDVILIIGSSWLERDMLGNPTSLAMRSIANSCSLYVSINSLHALDQGDETYLGMCMNVPRQRQLSDSLFHTDSEDPSGPCLHPISSKFVQLHH